MSRLADIRRRVAGTNELLGIIGAMRSLAGMRLQEAQHALPGMRRYAQSLAGGIAAAVQLLSDRGNERNRNRSRGCRLMIVYASEHGFVGGFNERLLERAASEHAELLFVLGSRGAALALERGLAPAWVQPMPMRLDGLTDAANRLAGELYRRIGAGEIGSVDLLFTQSGSGPARIERSSLLPLDVAALAAHAPGRPPPLHNLAPRELFEKLAAEYVYARLAQAAVESIASENAARFAAMESAHDSISRKLAELELTEHEARQGEITDELLDLMTGWKAVAGEDSMSAFTSRQD